MFYEGGFYIFFHTQGVNLLGFFLCLLINIANGEAIIITLTLIQNICFSSSHVMLERGGTKLTRKDNNEIRIPPTIETMTMSIAIEIKFKVLFFMMVVIRG